MTSMQAGREGHDIIKVMKGKNLHPGIQEYTQQSFHSDLKDRLSFSDKQKLKEFSTMKLALQNC